MNTNNQEETKPGQLSANVICAFAVTGLVGLCLIWAGLALVWDFSAMLIVTGAVCIVGALIGDSVYRDTKKIEAFAAQIEEEQAEEEEEEPAPHKREVVMLRKRPVGIPDYPHTTMVSTGADAVNAVNMTELQKFIWGAIFYAATTLDNDRISLDVRRIVGRKAVDEAIKVLTALEVHDDRA